MRGKLQHVDASDSTTPYYWVVEFIPDRIKGNKWIETLPVHPDSTHYMNGLKSGKEVEFEMVYDDSEYDDLFTYAKITDFDPDTSLKERAKYTNENLEPEKDTTNYLPLFIDQFMIELDSKEWDVLEYLKWLKLNGFQIIKNNQ